MIRRLWHFAATLAWLCAAGCASAPPPTVVVLPAAASGSAAPSKPSWEAKLWADIKILWPCIKELRLHPASLVDDLRDVADMRPCIDQLRAANAGLAAAGADAGAE